MNIYKGFLLSFLLITPSSGHGTRGTFYERMLQGDSGRMCVNNPVCAAQGLTEGACCPNASNEYHSCCNRECAVHTSCSQLAGNCCPTIDNVDLACCDHQPAVNALTPSSSPSEAPSNHPSSAPSMSPMSVPSQTPSASATGPTTSSPSSAPSIAPTRGPTPPGCPSWAFRSISSVQPLTNDGGTIVFDLANLSRASANTVFVEVFIRGDYGQVYEFVEFQDEAVSLIGTMDPNAECLNTYSSQTFSISQQYFNSWLNDDGAATFTLQATSSVGTFCQHNDAYIVLCYETGSNSPSNAPSEEPSTSPSQAPSVSPSVSPSSQPSTSPSTTPSKSPSASPSRLPSSTPSNSPSGSPSSSPSGKPTGNPSSSPSVAPTLIEDRNGDDDGPTLPIFLGGPMCQDNQKCFELGLQGTCCPTPDGVNLSCCGGGGSGGGSSGTARACSANPMCAGLSGNCCPTNDGAQLACCGSD